MRLHDFVYLPQKEKVTVLYEQGIYIGKRKKGKTTVVLFQLETFYAEDFYRTYRRETDCIRCFSGTARLNPYLRSIDLEQWVI